MQGVENLFKKYGKIELKIMEEKNAYPTDKGILIILVMLLI